MNWSNGFVFVLLMSLLGLLQLPTVANTTVLKHSMLKKTSSPGSSSDQLFKEYDEYLKLASKNNDQFNHYMRLAASVESEMLKKKSDEIPSWIDEKWVRETYKNLLGAKKSWKKLREDYPKAYDYESKIRELNQKIESLRVWLESNQEDTQSARESDQSKVNNEGISPQKSFTDETGSDGDTSPESSLPDTGVILPPSVSRTQLPDTSLAATGSVDTPVSSENKSSTKILVPDTFTAGTPSTSSETEARTDDELSDVFFQEEGIVAADLPAESELNVSGRQFIKVNTTSTQFPNDPERENQTNVNVEQQLQVKIRGSIADDLLEVNIDFDDSKPEVEQQKTRIFYNGRERDVGLATFQAEAKFGDVQLSLPGSTFVSYNKSVFGISGQAHLTDFNLGGWGPKRMSVYGVASEKKGETQKKEFTGKNRRRVPDPIPDISPIRRTYYQLLADFPDGSIKVDSERILVDDQNAENNNENTLENTTVENSKAGDTYTGDFDVLDQGEDYSINYRTGVLRLKQSIQKNSVIAVDFTLNSGTSRSGFMVKDQDESDSFDRYHLENRYQLASRNIVRNDPDRELEIRDPTDSSRTENGNSYISLLDMDQDGDGVIDDQFIDFELGVLRFPDTRPFVSEAFPDTNPTVYGPPADREQFFEIYQEILTEENTYQLGVNVVRDSEKVVVDGQTLERGRHYTIDYQTGFLSFFDNVEIDEETKIEVTYEEQGVGSLRDQTFFGGRLETTVSENLSFGSTLLTSQEQEQTEIPRVGQSTKSTTVSQLDVSWNPVRSLQDVIGWWGGQKWKEYPWKDDFKMDLQFDWAQSTRNPSQEGSALVDDFDQIDQRIPFSKSEFDWSPADAIQQFPGDTRVLKSRSPVSFEEVEGTGHDPNPDEDETQESMRVNLPMGSDDSPDTWGAFQQLISSNGQDLRGYDFLEFWVKWEGNTDGGTLAVDLGQTSENTDRSSVLRTEDDNNNQILNPGEDDGYRTFDFRFGEDNGQLDSEDLDQNGRLDEQESYLHFPAINKTDQVDTGNTSENWTVYKIPLQGSFGQARGNTNREGNNASDTPTRQDVLQNASTVRLVYESPDDSGQDRSFLLEQMGAVRSRWRAANASDSFQVDIKTSAEDNRLPAPETQRFRDDENQIDKGMSFELGDKADQLDSGSARANLDLPAGAEINKFKQLNLLLNTKNYNSIPSNSDTGFLRFGTDDSNYFQYRFTIPDPNTISPEDPNITKIEDNWYKLSIDLTEFEEDFIKKTLSETQPEVLKRGRRTIRGSPTLLKVKKYTIGLIDPEGGSLLFDGLSLDKVQEEEGTATQIQTSVDIRDGLLEFNARDREVEGEFRSIGLVNNAVANQFVPQNEVTQSVNGSFDVDRYIPNQWSLGIPLNFRWSDKSTRIPPDRIERVRSDNLGEVNTVNQGINSGLNTAGAYPNFNFSWSNNEKEVNQEERRGRRFRDSESNWQVGGNYGITFNDRLLGYIPVGDRLNVSTNGRYGRLNEVKKNVGNPDNKVDTSTREEINRQLRTSLDGKPASWLNYGLGLNFSDLTRKTRKTSGLITRDQSLDFSLTPRSFYGLSPSYNLETSINENFNRGGTVRKSVGLNGSSGLSLNTNPRKWWSALDFFTLTYRYRINSSARYNDLDPNTSNSDVYRNFYNGLSWITKGPDLAVTSDTLSLSRNRGSKKISHSLGGQLKVWKPLDSRYNLNFSQNFGQTDNSVNQTTARSVSLSNRLQLRTVSSIAKSWTSNSSLNVNYNYSTSESRNSNEVTHSPTLQLSTRWNRFWSTNFNLSTQLSTEENEEVTREKTGLSPSMDFKWLVNEKEGDGTLWFDNRFEISGNLSSQFNEVTRNGETREDNREISTNFSGAYNITKKIKTRFGGSYSVFQDNFREANNKVTYGINASVDFRF